MNHWLKTLEERSEKTKISMLQWNFLSSRSGHFPLDFYQFFFKNVVLIGYLDHFHLYFSRIVCLFSFLALDAKYFISCWLMILSHYCSNGFYRSETKKNAFLGVVIIFFIFFTVCICVCIVKKFEFQFINVSSCF